MTKWIETGKTEVWDGMLVVLTTQCQSAMPGIRKVLYLLSLWACPAFVGEALTPLRFLDHPPQGAPESLGTWL